MLAQQMIIQNCSIVVFPNFDIDRAKTLGAWSNLKAQSRTRGVMHLVNVDYSGQRIATLQGNPEKALQNTVVNSIFRCCWDVFLYVKYSVDNEFKGIDLLRYVISSSLSWAHVRQMLYFNFNLLSFNSRSVLWFIPKCTSKRLSDSPYPSLLHTCTMHQWKRCLDQKHYELVKVWFPPIVTLLSLLVGCFELPLIAKSRLAG